MVKMCQNIELIVKLWYFYNGKCWISDRKFKLKHNYEALIQYQPDFFSWKDINEKVRFWSLKKYEPAEDVVPIYLGIWGMPYKKWGLSLEKS